MWRQWKTPRRRRAALLELGVREWLANNTAGSGLGPWYLAKAKALSVGLSGSAQEFVKSVILRGLRDFPKSDVFGVGDGDSFGFQ